MVLMSAATGGAARRVFSEKAGLTIVTTDFTLKEAKDRVSRLIARYELDPDEVAEELAALPIKVYRAEEYESHLEKAKAYIEKRDPKDVSLLALVLKLEIPLWSHDKVFDEAPVERITTGRLLNELGV